MRRSGQGNDAADGAAWNASGDIVGLHITDIDWENARILICGKGRRQESLPLSQEIGTALLRYLQNARPAVRRPELFITALAPFRPIRRQSVATVVMRTIGRAGVNSPAHGAHVLRHSAATTMLRKGNLSSEHRSGASPPTAMYYRALCKG
jgi:integrase/recombinase XerD